MPTRVFHWLLVIAYIVAWMTYDDNRFLYVHVFAGYVFFSLLVFRLLWGMIGSHHSRFHTFAYDWKSVTEYLKGLLTGEASRHVGHNPIGGWAIFLIIGLGFIVSILGIVTLGGEEGHGLLKGIVSFDTGVAAHELHEELGFFMLAVTFVHLGGVIVESLIHKENLIRSMITGHKYAETGTPAASTYSIVGIVVAGLIIISGLYYFQGYMRENPDSPFLPYMGPTLPDNKTWRSECGDCHLAFHPSLLPARSWQKMMDTQDEHFGEDLGLDEDTVAEILPFLLKNSADAGLTEPSHRVTSSLSPGDVPLRVTEVPYWKKKHADIDKAYWKDKKIRSKANCGACHLDAKKGTFEDSDMRLPKLTPQ